MSKQVTSMELLTLLHKSNHSDTKLSLAERAVLSVILCHINYKLEKGYEAWPSTDILVAKTGLSTTGIANCRKSLAADGWIEIVSGRAAGVANHYFVNAEKIVAVAALGGVVHSGKAVAKTEILPAVKEQHKRDTSGLLQGKAIPTKPVAEAAPSLNWFEEPAAIVEMPKVHPVPVNSDGSNPFHRNGTRCHSYKDHEVATNKHIAEVNSGDEPF